MMAGVLIPLVPMAVKVILVKMIQCDLVAHKACARIASNLANTKRC